MLLAPRSRACDTRSEIIKATIPVPTTHPILCGSIAGRPGRFGVAMHTAAFQALGIAGTYVAFGTEDTAGAVAAVRTLGIRGLGVTMPHKERIAAFLDKIDEAAAAIGAVNTVVNDDGMLTGYNVDWTGAIRAIEERMTPAGKKAVILGAGGGARSVAFGLKQAGAIVTVLNRSEDRGRALGNDLGVLFGGPPEALSDIANYDLLAHVTPVGLDDPDTALIAADAMQPQAVVFDAVARPVETKLLRLARERGAVTIPGVRMQLHQAARQFQLYTGIAPDLGVMEQALAREIEMSQSQETGTR